MIFNFRHFIIVSIIIYNDASASSSLPPKTYIHAIYRAKPTLLLSCHPNNPQSPFFFPLLLLNHFSKNHFYHVNLFHESFPIFFNEIYCCSELLNIRFSSFGSCYLDFCSFVFYPLNL